MSKKPKGAGKGSAFERLICRKLSEWWSGGERDDIFWRTSNSGGRATIRSRSGQSTFGQYGDIQATDPIGQPLLDLVTFELKCGYPGTSPLDGFEAPKKTMTEWGKWIEQARGSAKGAATRYWVLVWKRNRKEPIIVCSRNFIMGLSWRLFYLPKVVSRMMMSFYGSEEVYVLRLSDWLEWVPPEVIRKWDENDDKS